MGGERQIELSDKPAALVASQIVFLIFSAKLKCLQRNVCVSLFMYVCVTRNVIGVRLSLLLLLLLLDGGGGSVGGGSSSGIGIGAASGAGGGGGRVWVVWRGRGMGRVGGKKIVYTSRFVRVILAQGPC